MDVRKKLVELQLQADIADNISENGTQHREFIADLMIANGVTVQEWISVKDKLPPYNRDVLVYRPNMAMKFLVDNYEGYYGEDDDEWHEGWVRYGKDVHGNQVITHWSYLPQPPKGE